MDRSKIVHAIDRMYEARLAADVDGCVACFAPTGLYRMANVFDAQEHPLQACGHEQLRLALTELVAIWRWVRRDQLSLMVEGDSASVRYRVALVHLPTGEEIDTQMMDHVSFDKDYRATVFEQFVDTALVARLSAEEGRRG